MRLSLNVVNLRDARAGRDLDGRPGAESAKDCRLGRILINMERWRWLPEDLGEFYVWDNVPEFLTRVVKERQDHPHRQDHRRPADRGRRRSFSADMKMIVFHPSWGVPDGIKTKELAPLLRKSSGGGLLRHLRRRLSARPCSSAYELRAYATAARSIANSVDWGSVDIRRLQLPAAAGAEERARRREVHVPQQARRLHARHAGAEPVRQDRSAR